MKKVIAGLLGVTMCFGMAACSSEDAQEVSEAEACSHDWALDGERPACKLCGEERDGTTQEAVQYLWKDDVELDNGSDLTMTNSLHKITLTLSYPQSKDNKMADVISLTKRVYNQEGYLDSDIKKILDGFYELYMSDAAIGFMTDSYPYYDTYCGENLSEFIGEIYYGSELMGRYVNGKETYNLFNDELKVCGYHHN